MYSIFRNTDLCYNILMGMPWLCISGLIILRTENKDSILQSITVFLDMNKTGNTSVINEQEIAVA